MRKTAARCSATEDETVANDTRPQFNPTAHAAVGIGALPVLDHGVGRRRVDAGGYETMIEIVSMLVEAGEVADVDTGEPLEAIAKRGLTGWLEKSWGGLKHFDLGFTLCSHILEAVDDAQEGDPNAERRLAVPVMEDFGIDLNEPMIAFSVTTTGQRWTRVGPKVLALEEKYPGLGWEALRAVGAVGTSYGMFDFSFLEFAASHAYWAGGDSEKDWALNYQEDEAQFDGMTRAEFDEAIPLKIMFASKPLLVKELQRIAKQDDLGAEVAKKLLALRKLKGVGGAFQMPKCDEAGDYFVSDDAGVILEWTDTEPVRRIVDDFMNPYMQSGEGLKDRIGAIALRLDGGKHMMELTRQWNDAAWKLRHADRLLDLIAEDEDAVA